MARPVARVLLTTGPTCVMVTMSKGSHMHLQQTAAIRRDVTLADERMRRLGLKHSLGF